LDQPSAGNCGHVGTRLVTSAIGLAVLGLTQGSDWGWGDARTLACLCCGAARWLLVRSMRHPAPAVETDLWRSRIFSAASLGSLTFAWRCRVLLLGPIFLTMVWHYSILKAGLQSARAADLRVPQRGRRQAGDAGAARDRD